MILDQFDAFEFENECGGGLVRHDVYVRGKGPLIVILQELPGIGGETEALANHFVDHGFTVALPHLLGPLGELHLASNFFRAFCMRREFALFQKHRSSPIVDWLRALCRYLCERHSVQGVGVIGMCLTGNFAISMMADAKVLASVAAQPSLPVGMDPRALHMSRAEIAGARERLDHHGPMYAYRFEGDRICKAPKFDAINDVFNDDKERIILRQLPGTHHSVFTLDLISGGVPAARALDEITAYFQTTLK
ncbi:MAG: dienelactone hydrolase family protein [Pseudomonadota bacterium]